MAIDPDAAYRALQSRDARFDGAFFVGVRTTGIYCRPSCAARTPHRHNVEFHVSAAAAQRAGFRACKRCRPDATPGSADWNVRADLAGRAVRLIADGVVDRSGVGGLADRLGYSARQVNRALVTEIGAPPLALARAQRAQTARILLERTDMPAADVAFASGFASVRQFNETMRAVFDSTPTALRTAGPQGRPEPGRVELRLPFRSPIQLDQLFGYLAARAVAGLEAWSPDSAAFTRVLDLPHGPALVELAGSRSHVSAVLRLRDHRDLGTAVTRVRRLLDLDADPVAVDDTLRRLPAVTGSVDVRPGLRSPGGVDGFELAVRTVVGQQVSVAGARAVLGRIVASYGERIDDFGGNDATVDAGRDWRMFPAAPALAALTPAELPLPQARGRTVIELARAVADGDLVLDAGSDRAATRRRLLAIGGIGPWTADYVLMRALGDPDVLLETDLVLRREVARLSKAGRWSADTGSRAAPWRSYLTRHLWVMSIDRTPTDRTPAGHPRPGVAPTGAAPVAAPAVATKRRRTS